MRVVLGVVFGAIWSLGACSAGISGERFGEAEEESAQLATARRRVTTFVADGKLLSGASLGDKQLVFTFDDGPGDRSSELSTYLKAHRIPATFFVVGSKAAGRAALLAQYVADGHVVGNHTQDHDDLTDPSTDVLGQVTPVDTLLGGVVPDGHYFLRAPYGKWNDAARSTLLGSSMNKYVGPIYWQMGGTMNAASGTAADWACWQQTFLTTTACGDLYLQEITAKNHGIILMHDPYGWDHGSTVDMVKYIVPILETRGYTFVRLSRIPEVAALTH